MPVVSRLAYMFTCPYAAHWQPVSSSLHDFSMLMGAAKSPGALVLTLGCAQEHKTPVLSGLVGGCLIGLIRCVI